jgi:hypothetical protein
MATAVAKEPLRVLLVREKPVRKDAEGKLVGDRSGEPGWVAVCLEHFIVADGETLAEVKLSFEATLYAEILHALEGGRIPLADLGPAPEKYHLLWRTADPLPDHIIVNPPEGSTGPAVVRRRSVEVEVRIAA